MSIVKESRHREGLEDHHLGAKGHIALAVKRPVQWSPALPSGGGSMRYLFGGLCALLHPGT